MSDAPPPREKLFDFQSGRGLMVIAVGTTVLLGVLMIAAMLWQIHQHRQRSLALRGMGDGVHAESYGFDLASAQVPVGEILASGRGRESIRALTAPQVLSVAEVEALNAKESRGYDKFLAGGDRVVGVEIAGESRCYPLRLLTLHEIINDTLGGEPIAVTYDPLCDSVVVVSRKLAGETLEFGVSGLVYQSNLLLYDRREVVREASLWSQLQWKAISGPKAGTSLTLLPSRTTGWNIWKAGHPQTTILNRAPGLKREYEGEPYHTYYASSKLLLPVTRPWTDKGEWKQKTPVLAVASGGTWAVYALPTIAEHAAADRPWQAPHPGGGNVAIFYDPASKTAWTDSTAMAVPTLLFAWYAQHPDACTLVP